MRGLWLGVVAGVGLGVVAWGQVERPKGVPDERVRLEARDGKTQFYLGDRIVLDLVFAARPDAAYAINDTVYGDLSEGVEIAPATGWVRWRGQSGHDYASVKKVGAEEVRIPVVLNEGFAFREAGHYDVTVTTYRMEGSGGPVVTNAVGIDLSPMPEDVERARVRAIEAEIGAVGDTMTVEGAKEDAWDRLAALGGDDALRLKVKLILGENERMRGVADEALASTRNLALQLKLLEAAWRDPAQMPVYDLLGELEETRRLMRGETEPGWEMVATVPKQDEATMRRRRETAADVDAMVRSVPMRSGENRNQALYLLFDTMPLTPEQQAALRPVMVEEFPRMTTLMQGMLLQTRWPAIRDKGLAGALEADLGDGPKNDPEHLGGNAHWSIKRLIDVAPEEAKPYAVRLICGKTAVQLEAVEDLPDATLPEVDECLSTALRAGPVREHDLQWDLRAQLAGRFGTAKVLAAVEAGRRYPSQDGEVLAVKLRWEPAEAVAEIRKSGKVGYSAIDKVFDARKAAYPAEMRAYLRERMETGDAGAAGEAAGELSRHGTGEDKEAIEARLVRLRREHAAKGVGFVNAAEENTDADARLEIELMGALRLTGTWFVNNAEAAELARGCLSASCRRFGEARAGDAAWVERRE